MNAILPEQTDTTKKDAKNLRNRISYQKIPTEKRVALLALRRAKYSALTHALPQNLTAVHFTKTDSGRQIRRLQYESPGFCCSNGSIKLVSHKLPQALKSLLWN
ncbi:hypothetical protein H5410_064096 [Solanum commersonii]|uniref:Uncharacterized protein n=1 Tax=Solanum commersonii TaxID=4109 RepID=A0A9J5W0K8_SOLCO|nr:hypothetical protein H5410_064096 [Solanum commersonii]